MSFIESTGVTYSDSVNHNRVQVLSIPVLLLACSQLWLTESEQATPVDSIKNVVWSFVKVPKFDKHSSVYRTWEPEDISAKMLWK